MRFLGPDDVTRKGDKLYRNGSIRPLIRIDPDSKYPDMWRVRLFPAGSQVKPRTLSERWMPITSTIVASRAFVRLERG